MEPSSPQETKKLLLTLLNKVKSGLYTVDLLDDPDTLANKIAKDIECSPQKAMSVLGYLLKFGYVKIEPDKGIILIKWIARTIK